MKLKECMLVAGAIALLASCNNAGSDKEVTDTTTTYDNTDNTRTTTSYTTVEVPATTRTTFETKYPKASNVNWYRYDPANTYIDWEWSGWPMLDTSDYVARFSLDGRDYWAWYDDKGEWVGTVATISDYSMLPAGVTATINAQYPGYTVVSANLENDKNRNAYEITLEKGSDKAKVLVDENGKIMKKKAITGGVETKEKPIKDSM